MISVVEILLFLLCFIVAFIYFTRNWRNSNLPPGPWNIPLYSGIFKIAPQAHITFRDWAKKYGPLILTKIGLTDTIIIDDVDIMREAFANPAINGRAASLVFDVLSRGKGGITFSDGKSWEGTKRSYIFYRYVEIGLLHNALFPEQRRFVMRTLRDFGYGKISTEGSIMEEVEDFLKWMKDKEGVPIDMSKRFVLATVSSLWTLLAGERQSQDDKILEKIVNDLNSTQNEVSVLHDTVTLFSQLVNFIPKMFMRKYYSYIESAKPVFKLIYDAIEQHIQFPVEKDQPRDLIDAYLSKVEKTIEPDSSFHEDIGRDSLASTIINLYQAASCTTSSLLNWTVLYLARYPEVQKKLQYELDNVIGTSRPPSITDRLNLPYMEALTREILRCSSIFPLSIPHQVTEDTTLGDYELKKGTIVIPNLWSMNHSETVYGDPENFKPERFLSTDGKFLRVRDIVSFGLGKRQCAGESIAKDNYFLFVANMYQRFQILTDPANPSPTLEGTPGIFRDAQKFKVVIKERD